MASLLAAIYGSQYAHPMIGDLRRLIAAQPFLPFTIHMANGAQWRIPTVDHIAVAPRGARVIVFADDDSTVIVSALLIDHISTDPDPAQTQTA